MFFKAEPMSPFFLLIFLTGILTSTTDIKFKKIYNSHLILCAALGLMSACYVYFVKQEDILSNLINAGIAFLIGWIFYHFKMWRGGDAKLFTLLAFLMPSLEHQPPLHSSALYLFACSFVIGLIIFVPVFIRDIVMNSRSITSNIIETRDALLEGAITSIFFNWILFPIYAFFNITNPLLILTISYLLFNWGYDETEKKDYFFKFLHKKRWHLFIGILFGFLMRLCLNPHSLALDVLTHSLLRMIFFVMISAFIHTALKHLKEYKNRVPFAPLLFLGCILSYTPFLTWIILLAKR